MANLINVPDCGGVTSTFNSGVPLCDIIRDIPYGLIFLDSGVTFNASELASPTAFKTALATACRAARGSRAYPMWDLKEFNDNSKAPTKGTIGNLSNAEIQLIDGIPSFSFAHRKGDIFHSQLSKAESANLKMLIVDKKYAVYGTENTAGELAGFTLAEFKAQLPKFQTPSAASLYPFEVTLDSITEYKENAAFFQADSTIVSCSGNNNVVLAVVQATNVAKITPTSSGGKNIGVIYPTELAVVGAWVSTNDQTGVAGTITSVSWDATNLRFNITTDSTEYAALTSGQKLTINLASPAALSALGVDGFESTGGVKITHA